MTSPPPRSWKISSTRPNGGTGSCLKPAAKHNASASWSGISPPAWQSHWQGEMAFERLSRESQRGSVRFLRRCHLGEFAQNADLPRAQHAKRLHMLAHRLVGIADRPGKAIETQIGASALQVVAPDRAVPHTEDDRLAVILRLGVQDIAGGNADIGRVRRCGGRASCREYHGSAEKFSHHNLSVGRAVRRGMA